MRLFLAFIRLVIAVFIPNYKPRKISGIDKTDSKVAIIGKVVESGKNSFVLDDGTGKIEVAYDSEAEKVEKGKLVRVFCTLVGDQLKAEIVQSLNGFDIDLFKKVEELYSKTGV